eukprot:639791-Prorocentrum_minimum.AAC.2
MAADAASAVDAAEVQEASAGSGERAASAVDAAEVQEASAGSGEACWQRMNARIVDGRAGSGQWTAVVTA